MSKRGLYGIKPKLLQRLPKSTILVFNSKNKWGIYASVSTRKRLTAYAVVNDLSIDAAIMKLLECANVVV